MVMWKKYLGHGIDGIIWKVPVDGKLYTLKVVGVVVVLSPGRADPAPVLGQQAP